MRPAPALPADLVLRPADAELAAVVVDDDGLRLRLSVVAASRPDPDHPLRPLEGWLRDVTLRLAGARWPAGTPPTPGRLRQCALQQADGPVADAPWPLSDADGGHHTVAGALRLHLTLVDGGTVSLEATALRIEIGPQAAWHETLAC